MRRSSATRGDKQSGGETAIIWDFIVRSKVYGPGKNDVMGQNQCVHASSQCILAHQSDELQGYHVALDVEKRVGNQTRINMMVHT